jgi:hypothetical protein
MGKELCTRGDVAVTISTTSNKLFKKLMTSLTLSIRTTYLFLINAKCSTCIYIGQSGVIPILLLLIM